jgi:hypothetical protein
MILRERTWWAHTGGGNAPCLETDLASNSSLTFSVPSKRCCAPPQDDVLVLIAGQPRGTHEMLVLLRAAMGESEASGESLARVRLLLRQHPRATAEERQQAERFK